MSNNALTAGARTHPVLCALGLVLLVGFTYSAAPLGDFVWDDRVLVVEQADTLRNGSLEEFFLQPFFPPNGDHSVRNFYRPIVKATFAGDLVFWGLAPAGFHLTNVALHLLNTLLLFLLVLRHSSRVGFAFFLAAGFGVSPRLSEAVAWISGRTDLLATLFCLLALCVNAPDAGLRASLRRWLAAILILAGLLSKESAVAGALAVTILEWKFSAGRRVRERLLRITPFVAAVVCYGVLRLAGMSGIRPGSSLPLRFDERVVGSFEALGQYVVMLATPWAPKTQIGEVGEPSWPVVGIGVLVLIFTTWLLARRRLPRDPKNLASLVLFLVPLGLVAFVPLPLNVVAADRFLYLPLAGLALLAASWPNGTRGTAPAILGVGLLVALSLVTMRRVETWRSDVSLWEPTANSPDATSYAYVQLADAFVRAGNPAAALPVLDQGERLARRYDDRHPGTNTVQGVMVNRGLALFALERFRDAEETFRWLHERNRRPEILQDLAVCLAAQLRLAEAAEVLASGVQDARTTEIQSRLRSFVMRHPTAGPESADAPQLRAELLRSL